MALIPNKKKPIPKGQRGMSLVELMISMVVLLVGLVANMSLVAISIGGNGRNRQQSNSTVISQMVTEKISSLNVGVANNLAITDCTGTSYTVNTTAGGSPLLASGDVDFSQAPVANYSMTYTACGTNGEQTVYDVRWNVQQTSSYVKFLTVSTKMRGATTNAMFFSLPVTIRTLIGQGT